MGASSLQCSSLENDFHGFKPRHSLTYSTRRDGPWSVRWNTKGATIVCNSYLGRRTAFSINQVTAHSRGNYHFSSTNFLGCCNSYPTADGTPGRYTPRRWPTDSSTSDRTRPGWRPSSPSTWKESPPTSQDLIHLSLGSWECWRSDSSFGSGNLWLETITTSVIPVTDRRP